MNWAAVWSIARAEARLARRLVRYWVFLVLSCLISVVFFLYYFFLHYSFSGYSGTVAGINPRYLVGAIGNYFILVFSLGAIFLACEVRSREERERIAEALDARPVSNPELLAGKFAGLLLASWAPAAGIAVILGLLGWLIGAPIQPRSLFTLAVFMAAPAFAFIIGLTFLVALVIRLRWVTVIAVVVAAVGLFWLTLRLPFYATAAGDFIGNFAALYPSDLTPGVASVFGWLQRAAVLLAAGGLLALAAAVHPRRDDGDRRLRSAVGLLLLLAAGAGLWVVVNHQQRPLALAEVWRAAHGARKADPAPDIVAISGLVRIEPPRSLAEDLTVTFRAPEGKTLGRALFTLNPGFSVESAVELSGAAVPFAFQNGLLDLTLPHPVSGDADTTIRLKLSGGLDPDFPYFDAQRQWLSESATNAQLFLLGTDSVVFTRRYAALLEGARWLPAGGAEVGRDDPRVHAPDFFRLDLTVEVPSDWLVAGPARRTSAAGAPAGRVRFRFAPPAPVPGAALVAGRFESRSVDVRGVHFEALIHRSHAKCLDVFDDAALEIRQTLEKRLKEAAEGGLAYPYDSLTLVEAPNSLRGYGGGWRMDTTFAPPAMVLARESGFPTARFSSAFKDPAKFRDKEGGMPRAKRERLERFFQNDFSGGNAFSAAARGFFADQTAAAGPDAIALDYVVRNLSEQWLTGGRSYFSAYVFDRKMNELIGRVIGSYFSEGGAGSFADAVIRAVTSRPAVWDAALGTALGRLDPPADPRKALDILTLRGGGLSASLLDGLGKEKVGRLLGALRTKRQGQPFTRADLIAAGQAIGEDLTTTLRDGLDSTALPGFIARNVRVARLADTREGVPRYQVLLTIQNDESTPGLVALNRRVAVDDKGGTQDERVGPFRVPGKSAIEVGVVTSRPVDRLVVAPYLSVNREPFAVTLPPLDPKKIEPGEPFSGSRDVPWSAPPADEVVVDDLDPGFRTFEAEKRGWLRLGGQATAEETDGGLPAVTFVFQPPARWSRAPLAAAYGKYRHTVVLAAAGTGAKTAVFKARLPKPGAWRLDWFAPASARTVGAPDVMTRAKGTWSIKISAAGAPEKVVEFNADAAEPGWNNLGTFDVPGGDVQVELSDKTSGRSVAADAVRWRPAAETR